MMGMAGLAGSGLIDYVICFSLEGFSRRASVLLGLRLCGLGLQDRRVVCPATYCLLWLF